MSWKPRNYKKNLEQLKKRSHELHRKMEDGSFYELSYFVRYREVRKIKQLYNRLMGPLSEGALKQAVSFASVLMLITGAGCDSSSEDTMAQVTLQLNIESVPVASAYSMASLSKAPAPDGVTDITLTISGAGMKTIVKTISPSTGFISLLVPGGDDRLFQVRADMTNEDYYTGIATADLVPGKLNSVSIPMTFVDAENEPPVPGNSGTIVPGTITLNSIDLSWTAGTDNVTLQADLEYAVYRSSSNNISTADDCETYGTLIQNFTPNLTAITVADLTQETSYYFNIVVRDEAGNTAAYTMINESTLSPDTVDPTPGGSGTISIGTVTFNSIDLSWTAATDDITVQADLQYAIYRNGTLFQNFTTYSGDPITVNITGLSPATEYSFIVYVRDEAGNTAAYASTSATTDVMNPIFVSNEAENPLSSLIFGTTDPVYPSFGDLDGDGDPDLMISSGSNMFGQVINYYYNDSGYFTSTTNPSGLDNNTSYRMFVNLDGDSDLDILSSDYISGGYQVFMYTNTSSMTFTGPVSLYPNIAASNALQIITSGDLNNDGDYDIVIGRRGGGTNISDYLEFRENTGTPDFSNILPITLGSGYPFQYALAPMLVDIDNDGDLDLVIGQGYYDTLTFNPSLRTLLFTNTGNADSPVFSDPPDIDPFGIDADLIATGTTHVYPAFIDVDNDGDLDMFIGTNIGTIRFYENTVLP